MQPARGDYVVEPVPGAPQAERVRVRRFGSVLDLDLFFASEREAVGRALDLAKTHKRRAYLRTAEGWSDLRPN